MKKLSKIKLQNVVVLEESEMKAIYGGSGGSGGSGTACSGGGINNKTCSGECAATTVFDPVLQVFVRKEQTCNPKTVHGPAGSGDTFTSCQCS